MLEPHDIPHGASESEWLAVPTLQKTESSEAYHCASGDHREGVAVGDHVVSGSRLRCVLAYRPEVASEVKGENG